MDTKLLTPSVLLTQLSSQEKACKSRSPGLNGLNVFAANIINAYLQTPSSPKDYIIC